MPTVEAQSVESDVPQLVLVRRLPFLLRIHRSVLKGGVLHLSEVSHFQ